MTRHTLTLLLALFTLSAWAQKKKPLIDMPLNEQHARITAEHITFEPYITRETDTITFALRIDRPGIDPGHLYDITREAVLEVFGDVQPVTDGRTRLMFRTTSTITGVHPTLSSHSDIGETVNIITTDGAIYVTIRLHGYSCTVEGFDGMGRPKTNISTYSLADFYPINPDKANSDPLASWNSIRPHYAQVAQQLRHLSKYITAPPLFLPE